MNLQLLLILFPLTKGTNLRPFCSCSYHRHQLKCLAPPGSEPNLPSLSELYIYKQIQCYQIPPLSIRNFPGLSYMLKSSIKRAVLVEKKRNCQFYKLHSNLRKLFPDCFCANYSCSTNGSSRIWNTSLIPAANPPPTYILIVTIQPLFL